MDLDSMKYADLRSLAKELGLKANGKADKLLKAIKDHYQKEKDNDVQGQSSVSEGLSEDSPDAASKEPESSVAFFVNTRRGNGSKRKLSDTSKASRAAQVDGKPDACSTPSARGNKKRKLSCRSSGKPESDGNEQQHPDIKDEGETEKRPKVVKAGKIPCYKGSQQNSKTLLKPVTPNFKKIHEAQFNKMESIDTYFQRKTKQMETLKTSVKDLKDLSEKPQPDSKAREKTNPTRTSLFSPALMSKRPAEEKSRHTLLPVSKALLNKHAGKEEVPFRPAVISTRRINVRFSEATCDNEFKRSLVKTPARMSLHRPSSTPRNQTADIRKSQTVNTSTVSAQETPGPFVFTGNTSTTPGTQKKPTFDLKASLSRPLGYNPHKGKLRPFGVAKENASANKSLISNTHQESYKQHKVQSREDRRTKQAGDRKQKKESMLGARRGLIMK